MNQLYFGDCLDVLKELHAKHPPKLPSWLTLFERIVNEIDDKFVILG